MLFKVTNMELQRVSHCGVMEFVADEGVVYLPFWMMENLCLQEGQMVEFQNISLPKGTFVKLRPHTTDFLDISNPKAVLEHTLRNFTCLTVGDTIAVNYNNKKYLIDIVEAKPQEQVSIIETDCEVDFAPPKDYKEPERKPAGGAGAGLVGGVGSLAGGASGGGLSFGMARPGGPAGGAAEPEPEPAEPRFHAFTGSGNRLDGKSVASRPMPPPAAKKAEMTPADAKAQGKRPSGKLMFGGSKAPRDPSAPPKPPPPRPQADPAEAEPPSEEGPKFKAFSGKANSLK